MDTSDKARVVINFKKNGDFFIYSDPAVEVLCRETHLPGDELYRYGTYPIPEEWLHNKPVGFLGDGSEEDKKVQLIKEVFRAARAAREGRGA